MDRLDMRYNAMERVTYVSIGFTSGQDNEQADAEDNENNEHVRKHRKIVRPLGLADALVDSSMLFLALLIHGAPW